MYLLFWRAAILSFSSSRTFAFSILWVKLMLKTVGLSKIDKLNKAQFGKAKC